MLRTETSVARNATDSIRTRGRRPRIDSRHARIGNRELIRPDDLGLGHLFTLTREAVAVGNLDTGRIALWNPAAEQLFGWSAAQAFGRPLDVLLPPAILQLYRADLDLHRHENARVIESHRAFEAPAITARGEEIRVEVTLAGVEPPTRPGRYVVAMMRDVTERRRAEQQTRDVAQVESARHDAEQMVTRQAQAVEDGVREIRRELRRLRRSAQRLTRQTAQPHQQRGGLGARVVEVRTERLGRELDRLAIRAAIESSTLEPQLERVNLVPLIAGVVARTRSRSTAHKLNAALPQGLTAGVDPRLIEHVVQALIDHTLTRCPRGCWIDVDLRRPLVGLARIEIREFGQPVSAEARQRLLQENDADPGLALVRSIVELHGGTLGFEFPADGGVLAIVTLPTQRGRVLA